MMMGAPVFALTGYAVASHVIPRGFACRSLVWLGRKVADRVCNGLSYRRVLLDNLIATAVCVLRGHDACMRIMRIMRIIKYDDGAPVFALTGYAVASHVIPRGFACRSVVWLGRRVAVGVCEAT